MTPAVTDSPFGPTVRIQEALDRDSVAELAGLLDHLASTARLLVDLSRAREVDPAALVQLRELVARHRLGGREVQLLGLTLGQARLLDLALGLPVQRVQASEEERG